MFFYITLRCLIQGNFNNLEEFRIFSIWNKWEGGLNKSGGSGDSLKGSKSVK